MACFFPQAGSAPAISPSPRNFADPFLLFFTHVAKPNGFLHVLFSWSALQTRKQSQLTIPPCVPSHTPLPRLACQRPVTLAYAVTVLYSTHAQTSSGNHVRALPCTITSASSTPPCRSQPLHVPSINFIHFQRTAAVPSPSLQALCLHGVSSPSRHHHC